MNIYIPPELANQEHRIKRFFDAMIYKLRKNAHKSGFETADIPYCLKRMKDEVEELEQAIAEGNTTEIVLEGADVSNFAMIVAVAAIERGAGHTGGVVTSGGVTERRSEYEGCHASSDGECQWVGCPQGRDGEPKRSGRHCPLDSRYVT